MDDKFRQWTSQCPSCANRSECICTATSRKQILYQKLSNPKLCFDKKEKWGNYGNATSNI